MAAPFGVVTVTLTVPVLGGAIAVIWVALLTVKLVALTPPNWTAVAPVRTPALAVMTTLVPCGPCGGAGDVMLMVGGNV